MRSNREVLEDYGVNYDFTMERFMGNEMLYVKILCKLGGDDNARKLNDAVAAGDMTEAFNAAHALKGVSANLGLTPLMDAVQNILEPLRKGEARSDYMELNAVVQEQFVKASALGAQLQR